LAIEAHQQEQERAVTYSNSPAPDPYAHIPSPLPNIDFPTPYWINKLARLIIIGCLDPDIAYGALIVPAAAKMLYDFETPSTKQIIEAATGQSWICHTKQAFSTTKEGSQIAQSDTGRFLYGLVKGLDIAAYYAFAVSTGAKGVIDYASFAARFQRKCGGGQGQWTGDDPVGGWGAGFDSWQTGPSWLNSVGTRPGPFLTIPRGYVGCMIASCSFTSLFATGLAITSMRIVDEDTGEVHDQDRVDNLVSVGPQACVAYFTTEGLVNRDVHLAIECNFAEAPTTRVVPANGFCYIRAWHPTAGDAPSYLDIVTNKHHQPPG
jgi:hypothetical protein